MIPQIHNGFETSIWQSSQEIIFASCEDQLRDLFSNFSYVELKDCVCFREIKVDMCETLYRITFRDRS